MAAEVAELYFCNLMGWITGWLLKERRKRKEIHLVNRVELFGEKKHAILLATGIMVAR